MIGYQERKCDNVRKSGGTDKYVRVVQDVYEDREIVVRCVIQVTDGFKVGMGLCEL